MKKCIFLALSVLLAFSVAACGRNNNTRNRDMTIMPDILPTLETNIPDPDVDTKMPMYTDGTDETIWTIPTETQARNRRGF